jgi:hypothetical protein
MTVGGSGQITNSKVACLEIRRVAPPSTRRRPPDRAPELAAATASVSALEAPDGPVGAEARLAIEIAREGPIRLSVYDVRGRRVALLQEGPAQPGRYEILWSASDTRGRRMASGIYFVRLEAPDTTLVRRIVLVR